MAFFTSDKLKRRRIKIDPSAVSARSHEVQNRLQRIDENYQAFDKLFEDIQATIENDDRLREFNANLRAVDLQPKKKKRWRGRAANNGTKNAAASANKKKTSRRGAAVSKIKNAQISVSPASAKKAQSGTDSTKRRSNKKPR